jgi:hypothetical protein
MLVPIILILADFRIKTNEKRISYLIFFLFIISLLQAVFKTGLNMSIVATFATYLFLYSFYSFKLTFKTIKYTLINAFFIVFFVLYPSIFYQGGIYKTPIVALAMSVIFLLSYYIFTNKSFLFSKFLIIFSSFLIVLFILILSTTGRQILYEVFYGVYGLLGLDFFKYLADFLSVDVDRGSRGSSLDSSQTRIFFWTAILNSSMSDFQTFLFGHGHSNSFMDALLPDFKFLDKSITSPHNSFMTVIYQYGFIGLFLFFSYMRKIINFARRSSLIVQKDKKIIIASIIFSCTYAFFEVALESPHGAILFWFIILYSSNTFATDD